MTDLEDLDAVQDRLSWADDDFVFSFLRNCGNPTRFTRSCFAFYAMNAEFVQFAIATASGKVLRPFKSFDGVLFTA